MTNQAIIYPLNKVQPHIIDTDVLTRAQGYAKKLTGLDNIVFSPQNLNLFQWCAKGRGSAILEAYAGTGKTFSGLIGGLLMGRNIVYIVFGNAPGKELQEKLNILGIEWKQATAKTCHALGFAALKKAFGVHNPKTGRIEIPVERDKVLQIIKTHGDFKNNELAQTYDSLIAKLIDFAKQKGIGIVGSIDNESLWYDIIDRFDILDMADDAERHASAIVKIAMAVLKVSNTIKTMVDFADMIYLPLLLKLKFWRHEVVIMDEAQDANPVRMMLARVVLMAGGRFLAMGDRHQSIYAFTGAENDALDQLKRNFNAVTFPLTVTRRCSKAAVREAQQFVPDFEAHPDALEGAIERCQEAEFFAKYREELIPGNAIICRNTAPLVDMAFKCLRNKIPMVVEGRKIAEGLKALANRWKVKSLDALRTRLENHLEAQRTKLVAQKKEDVLANLEDKVESLYVVIDECQRQKKNSLFDLIKYLDEIFENTVDEETGKIIKQVFTGCTGHKSKGREWNNTFILGFNKYNPSPWARKEEDEVQEKNLMYVMLTRTKDRIIYVDVPLNPKPGEPVPN